MWKVVVVRFTPGVWMKRKCEPDRWEAESPACCPALELKDLKLRAEQLRHTESAGTVGGTARGKRQRERTRVFKTSAFIRLVAFQHDIPDQHASSRSLHNTHSKVCLFLGGDQTFTSNMLKEVAAFIYSMIDCCQTERECVTSLHRKPEEINGWDFRGEKNNITSLISQSIRLHLLPARRPAWKS